MHNKTRACSVPNKINFYTYYIFVHEHFHFSSMLEASQEGADQPSRELMGVEERGGYGRLPYQFRLSRNFRRLTIDQQPQSKFTLSCEL